jgi:TusA-related sulfurtransferase
MNYVQAKVFMEECDMGDIVELLLDDGEPIKNVPESFKQDGQKILAITPQSNGTQHLVRIEKTRAY